MRRHSPPFQEQLFIVGPHTKKSQGVADCNWREMRTTTRSKSLFPKTHRAK